MLVKAYSGQSCKSCWIIVILRYKNLKMLYILNDVNMFTWMIMTYLILWQYEAVISSSLHVLFHPSITCYLITFESLHTKIFFRQKVVVSEISEKSGNKWNPRIQEKLFYMCISSPRIVSAIALKFGSKLRKVIWMICIFSVLCVWFFKPNMKA